MLKCSTLAMCQRRPASAPVKSHVRCEARLGVIRVLGPLSTLLCLVTPLSAADPPQGRVLEDCLNALSDTANPSISCTYRALLTEDERADIRRLTRDIVLDAYCRVDVKIDRGLVTPALGTADHAFVAPPQPVSCDIKTNSSLITITGTFAPTVTFKDGVAVDGSPGLANVTGVNAYLAWPVVQYVNRAPGIRRDMLAMINAYKSARKPETRAALSAGSHLH